MATQARRIVVHGRVQGVGFRYFVQRAAGRLGLAGSVANNPDGTVEIVVEGDAEGIEQLIKQVWKGPPMSRVELLDVAEIAPTGRYRSFGIEGW